MSMLSSPSTMLRRLTGVPGAGGAMEKYFAPVGVQKVAVCSPSVSVVVTCQPGASLA